MFKDRLITQLIENRRLGTKVEVVAFEEALAALAELPREEIEGDLPRLFLAFDDSTKDLDLMWSLLHYIEDFDLKTTVHAFAQAEPGLAKYAKKWAVIFLGRILNSQDANATLRSIFPSLPISEQDSIRRVMEEIDKVED